MRAAFIVPCMTNLRASQFRVLGFEFRVQETRSQQLSSISSFILHNSPCSISSPRLYRNLAPALLANDFYGIDARQHLIRNREALRERLTDRLRAVKAGLAHQPAVGRARIERRPGHTRKRHQPPVGLKASSKRQKHFPLIEYIYVFVEHERMLEPNVRSQCRHRRGLALPFDGL